MQARVAVLLLELPDDVQLLLRCILRQLARHDVSMCEEAHIEALGI